MIRISFDLETLDTKATGVVLSLGAVMFDESKLYNELKFNFDIQQQLNWGRTIGAQTLLFWFQQNDAARVAATHSPIKVIDGLTQFAKFIKEAGSGVEMWANGQDFDLGLMGHMYDTIVGFRPWAYNAGRDMRTLVSVYGSKPDIPFEGEKHDALSDAKHQARIIQIMLKEIKNARQASQGTA